MVVFTVTAGDSSNCFSVVKLCSRRDVPVVDGSDCVVVSAVWSHVTVTACHYCHKCVTGAAGGERICMLQCYMLLLHVTMVMGESKRLYSK